MAMQGKSTSSDKPSLDVEQAEEAAGAFRPAWDAGDDDESWEVEGNEPEAPEANAIVANANAAARPSAETLDSASLIEVASTPDAAKTEPMPLAAPSSETATTMPVDESGPMMAEAASAAEPPTKPAAEIAPALEEPPIPIAATDPFRDSPIADPSAPDLSFVKKRSSRGLIFVAVGVAAAIGLVIALGARGDEPKTAPPAAQIGPAPESSADDIPPPPSKDELAATPRAPAKPTEKASTHQAGLPDAPKADTPGHASPIDPPTREPKAEPRRTDTPKTVAAATPHAEPKAPRTEPRATKANTASPAASPKSAPKSTGGGIVRDSPF